MSDNKTYRQLENFCKIIFHIIEIRTPHTMEHILRVPVLTEMIAKMLQKNAIQSFSDEELEQIVLAAKLHDCGKTTTADYLLEKSTKIEFPHNRIHEIRNRFEILRRDAEIAYLKKIMKNPNCKKEEEKKYKQYLKQLEEDFEFVAICNIGDMAVTETEIKRLKKIGAKKFTRTFNRLSGLSWFERNQLTEEQKQVYSKKANETLLQDNPEDSYRGIPTGELYNLGIFKGTLNREERIKIEQHAVQTRNILDYMQLPKEYDNMIKYAAEHHEQPCGKGYPNGIGGEQLSIPSRVITISDIFEALTSSGRPYKTPKKLSEAMNIMQMMKNKQQIDDRIYELCITKGIFMKYAKKYLSPEQIDVEDLSIYL